MTQSEQFDYERFKELSDPELMAYMEPDFIDPTISFPLATIRRMLADLDRLGELQLIYTLELGATHAPEDFCNEIPRFIAHNSQSVRLAASRALRHLPDKLITKNILVSAQRYAELTPEDEARIWTLELGLLADRVK